MQSTGPIRSSLRGRVLPCCQVARLICLAFSLLAFPVVSRAQIPSGTESEGGPKAQADKSAFTLFRPTPPELMRELQTDRPDQTEGPYTVDAGHFQLEMDLGSYFYDRRVPAAVALTGHPTVRERGGHNVQTLVVADPTLKLGLTNNIDAELILTPFLWRRTEDGPSADECSGIGDTTFRLKINLWGNDSGSTAFGLMPYVKFPTNTDKLGNHYVEGGLIVPLNIKLPYEVELGMMTEFDVLRNRDDDGYHLEWVNSIVLHKDLIPQRLNAYAEFYTSVSRDRHAGPLEAVDFGLLYAISPDVQLDAGVNFGITERAIDYNPFLGLSFRI